MTETPAGAKGIAGSVEIRAKRVDTHLAEKAIIGELQASSFRGLVGYSLILIGIILIVVGVAGNIDWSIRMFGIDSKLIDASPGIVCVVGGIILVLTNRPKIKITL